MKKRRLLLGVGLGVAKDGRGVEGGLGGGSRIKPETGR